MEPNFFEKLISEKDKEKKDLVKKMSELLDDSLDTFISLRKRKSQENLDIKLKNDKIIKLRSMEMNDNEDTHFFGTSNRHLNRLARLARIRNMQEETEDLERLIERENIEVVG